MHQVADLIMPSLNWTQQWLVGLVALLPAEYASLIFNHHHSIQGLHPAHSLSALKV